MLSSKECGGVIQENECMRKNLRTLQHKYAIRVSTIQEMRIIDEMEVSLHALVKKLTIFELRKFDHSQPPKVETTFKASATQVVIQKGREEASISR